MGTNINIERGGALSLLSKFPWTLLLVAYLVVVHYTGARMDGVIGYVFIGLGVVVLFVEFFKSGDISAGTFLLDNISAVVAVVVATGLMAYLVFKLNQAPTFFDWFGYAIILGDAILSPFNSFRTALRDFGVGG